MRVGSECGAEREERVYAGRIRWIVMVVWLNPIVWLAGAYSRRWDMEPPLRGKRNQISETI